MDLDAYAAAHGAEWERLAQLARVRRPSGAQADELIERYQTGAAQLATIRTTVGGSAQGEHLSLALWRARLLFTGVRRNPLRSLTVFAAVRLPAALYRVRWLTLAVAAVTAVVAAAYFVWLSTDPRAFAALGLPSDLQRYAEKDFVGYYSEYSEAGFAAQVWTNNAWIAAQCVVFGVLGIWVPYVVFQNAQNLGVSAAVMNHYDRLDQYFLYISPHGQLELYAIFLAAAAGLMIFWAWIAPGARTRAEALAQDGRAFFTLVVGLTVALLISGVIEGFVTRQDWPWPVKIGIGTLALAAVLVYQWVVGRRAVRAGETGDLEEFETGARRIVSV
ncbi:stage II sporulation protein M [Protaetiibacter mangrovi]|uniref:Stage II sporulation protein M n=1 Tax=Protaetiibacter mangrovi TaxID=2970926 RepID=A0ABT1ZFG5_9MICO|nr:stage II sporulation protein M [Protaetiibacter mangrovi]MCS0499445.1 stage II sporulation protein M [Protaetiibacter mangrovi]